MQVKSRYRVPVTDSPEKYWIPAHKGRDSQEILESVPIPWIKRLEDRHAREGFLMTKAQVGQGLDLESF